MKRKVVLFCIGLLVIIMVACSSKADEPDSIHYNIPDLSEEGNNAASNADKEGRLDKKEANASKEDTAITWNEDDVSDSILVRDSEFWSYLSDFKGITSNEENPLPGNLEINQKHDGYALNLMCVDSNSGNIYYANYGGDGYIYQLDGENSTMVLAMPACYLNIYDGNLYFLGTEKDDSIKWDTIKSIYRYNLSTKELTLVLYANVLTLYVDSNGLFYTAGLEDRSIKGYRLAFDSDTPMEIDTFYYPQYKGYLFRVKQPYQYVVLQNDNSGDEISVIPFSFVTSMEERIVIVGDVLYFSYYDKLYVLNLASGDRVIYDLDKFESFFKNGSNKYNIYGFTIFNNELILTHSSNLLVGVDIETGKTRDLVGKMDDESYSFTELYTDGERLFALGTKSTMNNEHYNKIFELIIPGEKYYDFTAKELNQ